MKPLECRQYTPGDESAILKLFSACFPGRTMSPEYWNWRFRDNPTGRIMIETAWDQDILAAHYAVSPVFIGIHGCDHLTGLSMTTMTHPEYRGRGLFTTLAERLYKRMAVNDFAAVWGFPNINSHPGFVRKLQWRDIYEIPMFRVQLDRLRTIPDFSSHITEIADFDKRFDDLWELVCSSGQIRVKRDLRYLQWRFSLNPETSYRTICYTQGDQLKGYAVFSRYRETDLQVVDLITTGDKGIGLELISAILQICMEEGVEALKMWLPVFDPLFQELEQIGFENHSPTFLFGARALTDDPALMNIMDIRKWRISMSDSDVF
jgi:GNAT superfamily N-acetyltransferase